MTLEKPKFLGNVTTAAGSKIGNQIWTFGLAWSWHLHAEWRRIEALPGSLKAFVESLAGGLVGA